MPSPSIPTQPTRRERSPARDATQARTIKRKEDTATGCRDLAAASLAQALPAGTANERRRFEHSATMWTARADLLDRLELRNVMTRAARLSMLDEPFLLHSGEHEHA